MITDNTPARTTREKKRDEKEGRETIANDNYDMPILVFTDVIDRHDSVTKVTV